MVVKLNGILKKIDDNVAHHVVDLIGEKDKQVKIRPMTMKHFKILLKTSEGLDRQALLDENPEEVKKVDSIVDSVLKDCVVEPKDFDPLELFSADWFYLLVMLRAVSKGNIVSFKVPCIGMMESTSGSVQCNEMLNLSVNLNELDKVERKTLDVNIKLPGNVKVHFAPPKRKDEYVLNDYLSKNEVSESEISILKIVNTISWIESGKTKIKELSLDDKKQIFDRLSYDQKEEIREGYDQLSFGIPMFVELKCSKCGFSLNERLVDLSDFFTL